jgi:hypothetical protein
MATLGISHAAESDRIAPDAGLRRCASYYFNHFNYFIDNYFSLIILYFSYYISKIEELRIMAREKSQNLERLKAQRNELNAKVRLMREELVQLHEPVSFQCYFNYSF